MGPSSAKQRTGKAHVMQDPANKSPASGPLWLLILLALLPAIAKLAVKMLGVTGYAFQSAYKVFQLAAPVFWRRKFGRHKWLSTVWPTNEPLPSATTWLLAVGVAMVLAGSAVATVLLLTEPLGLDRQTLREQFDAKFNMTPLLAIGVVLYLLTVNAALEELHFRAWLDRELAARFGDPAGILLSAVAFAGMHLFIFADMAGVTPLMLALVFVALFIGGVCWSLIARRPGGIHAAWLSHGLTDAGLLTWGLFWLGYFSLRA